jgi:hypothetical protein
LQAQSEDDEYQLDLGPINGCSLHGCRLPGGGSNGKTSSVVKASLYEICDPRGAPIRFGTGVWLESNNPESLKRHGPST